MLKNFRSFQLATELYHDCKKVRITGELQDQLHRASLSVCLNLAEGTGKRTQKERARFFTIALGSLREVQALIQILDLPELDGKADQLGAYIWKLRQNPLQLPS